MLEYLYSTDRGTTQIIIEKGIELSIPTISSEVRLAELSIPKKIEGLFPIVITRNDRQEYINASEAADSGNLTRLINLFSRLQEKILIKGLGLRA